MNRITWVDNLRGIGVLVVILLHCVIAVNGNVGHFAPLIAVLDPLLIPVFLGLVFFVSGLFVDAGLRKGLGPFINNKVQTILYPFIVWVVVYGGLKILFSSMANNPQFPLNVIAMHLSGGGDITWFLHSLFFFFLAIIVLRHLPFWLVIPGCLLLSYLLPGFSADGMFARFDNTHINKSINLFIFFYIGDQLVRRQFDVPRLAENALLVLLSLASVVLFVGLNMLSDRPPSHVLLAALALLSIPLFVWIALKVNSRLVHYVGVNSIVFYLSHYLVIQFFSKVVKLHTPTLWVQDLLFILAFAAAMIFPWTLCLLRQRGWFNFLFTLKSQPRVKVIKPV